MTQTLSVSHYQDESDKKIGLALVNSMYALALPNGPVQSVTSVKNGAGTTIDSSKWHLVKYGMVDYIQMDQDPTVWPVVIQYVAGYASADLVPSEIKSMMLGHIVWLWENRGLPDKEANLNGYRKHRVKAYAG